MADLTYVATQEGWLYLAGIKDVYTCEIVGYAMGERMTKELTGKALFMALRSQRPPAGLIHHSDRGSQYCAYDYRVDTGAVWSENINVDVKVTVTTTLRWKASGER
ncbi:putative transposase [Shigella sonnei 53G]|nr:putative transposase [Shigella sonnei 53G]